ncbi:carboxyl-terminal processing protease [Deinococcus metalli]|uniref:Protease n=1 Tax=Deinococcus metalli TaxID=1141878 RepID=A0A7W8KHD5_9DEIO|nr:S41 family peptidase [Deinococcus metalli]MBB5377818.1 carboxyl-terminal processing protease [Deinococcus metalli]GHF55718.1 protease [Deinococcus metalli]
MTSSPLPVAPLSAPLHARPRVPWRGARRLLLGAALLSGAGAHAATVSSPAQELFMRVNILIQQQYGGLSTVDRAALTREYQERLDAVCAADGPDCPESRAYPVVTAELTALGDDHSYFMTPDDLKDFISRATGGTRRQFGVKLASLDGENRVVTEVVPGSAADAAGLKRGDLLLTLNGKPYTYAGLRSARDSGTPITLGLTRVGQPLTLTLTSSESSTEELPLVQYVPAPTATNPQAEVAVLRIPTFLSGGGVAQRVHDLVGEAQTRGAAGMIVDLRGDPGGSLSECDSAVSAFVPTVTRLARSAGGNSRTVVSRGTRLEDGMPSGGVRRPHLWTGPLAVLVDQGSASCSEFFAYEVQYAGRGPIIGEATAGVGNTATRVFDAGKGGLQLTILNYAKPDGTPYPIHVTPDKTFAQGEAQLRDLTQGKDDLLQEGLKALNSAPVLGSDPYRQEP